MAGDRSDLKDRTRPGEGVVLRDESDEIIDNLKTQLASLQSQLDTYQSEERAPAEAGSGGGAHGTIGADWGSAITPHLAFRMQLPAEELTRRLDKLIDQISEPELKEELVRCRDLAFFFYETFNKISTNHRLLTESLTAPKIEVELKDFCKVLEHVLPSLGTPLPVHRQANLPRRMTFASRSAAAVVQALAELAERIFGRDLRIEVGPTKEDAGGRPCLCLRVLSDTAGEEAEEGEEVSVFAMRRGITAGTIVDLLYAEKIVELQDGRFAFYRRDGKVHGFEIELPFDPVED
ncbi:MAG: hypothetical protein O7C61_00475 [SAR324 cluster bacterium]|nr:hypothetical protein [SAR324 cluster bacterium]